MFPPNRFGPPGRPPNMPPKLPNQQKNPFSGYFKTPDGNLDFDKISGSIGELNKLVGQMSPVVKQLNGFLKKPR